MISVISPILILPSTSIVALLLLLKNFERFSRAIFKYFLFPQYHLSVFIVYIDLLHNWYLYSFKKYIILVSDNHNYNQKHFTDFYLSVSKYFIPSIHEWRKKGNEWLWLLKKAIYKSFIYGKLMRPRFWHNDEDVAKANSILMKREIWGDVVIVGAKHTVAGLDEDFVRKEIGYTGSVTIPPEKAFVPGILN